MQDFHYQNGTKIIFGRETEASVGQELKKIYKQGATALWRRFN